MNCDFFINRPRFAIVLSLFITILGLLSLTFLKLEKYPQVTPTQVNVSANYPGASADVVESTVATVIEQQVNGVENMSYMKSTSSDGSYSLSIFFKVGTNKDMALVNVQNRLQQIMSRLPEDVTRQGIVAKTRVAGAGALTASLSSPHGTYTPLELSNYAAIYIKEELLRVQGVGEVNVFGAGDYGMRVWMNPQTMANLGITTADIATAIRSQNVQVPAGALGVEPMNEPQKMQFTLRTKGRLTEPEQFENIVIKADKSGANVKIKDIARVELGSQNYSRTGRLNGTPNAIIQIIQLPDANIIDVADATREIIDEINKSLPNDMLLQVVHDETEYIKESMSEVVKTIFEAALIVVFLTYLFLGTFRATLIPIIAIPISLIGSLAILPVLGMSINTLILFAMVLAVGTVVDDAIVVIENIERHISSGLDKKQAAIVSMREVGGALVAIAMVLMAVFIPVAFIPGLSGMMYRQFSVCIATSVAISAIVALTLSPAMSAMILKEDVKKVHFVELFDQKFRQLTAFYMKMTKFFVYNSKVTIITYLVICFAAVILLNTLPKGFLPDEDQSVLFADVVLPDGASLARSKDVVTKMDKILLNNKYVDRTVSFIGFDGSNSAFVIIELKKYKFRPNPGPIKKFLFGIFGQSPEDATSSTLVNKFNRIFLNEIPEAKVYTMIPPAISGMGMTGGFAFEMLNKGKNSPQKLAEYANKLARAANMNPALSQVYTTYQANLPQYIVEVDEQKAMAQGVSLASLYAVLSAQFGSSYINDFNLFDRVFRVYIQAEDSYRKNLESLQDIYVQSDNGQMVPIQTMVNLVPTIGTPQIYRFNLYRSVSFVGKPAAGYSTGQAMKAMVDVLGETLPSDIGYAWSGQSLQEKESQGMTNIVIGLALLFVYLFLVALYESWTIPVAVILISPVAAVGALLAQYFTGQAFNLYSQVGMVMLIGLATKQAILIVEFAKDYHEKEGYGLQYAAMKAASLRFRAVIMTSVAFILGIVPLLVATGAGAESRYSVGITVFGGMLAACIFGTLLVPSFYVIIQSITDKFVQKKDASLDEVN